MRSDTFVGLRAMPVLGDSMAPTLRRGDFALVVPVSTYEGEGIYVTMDVSGAPALHRFERIGGGRVRVWSDNRLYERYEITLSDFLACVLAKVVITSRVIDRCLIPDALRV